MRATMSPARMGSPIAGAGIYYIKGPRELISKDIPFEYEAI
jgi:hypothetical protein